MKKTLLLTCLLCSALLLSACASTPSAADFGNGSGSGNGFGSGSGRTGLASIFSIFSGRRSFTLTPQEKLAIGTIKLDANGQAISQAEAAKLLPLWQLLHQLYSSSSAAPQEEAAVVDQIRSTMTSSQVAAIDGMQLSRTDIFAALQQGQANTSATGGASGGASGSRGSASGNGFRGNGGGQGFFFAGGPGAGFGGFRNGTGTGNGTNGATTTQQNITSAQRAAAATSGITNALINQVISLLQDKLSS